METMYRISFKNGDLCFEIESTDLKWMKEKEKYYLQLLKGAPAKRMEKIARPASPSSTISLPPQITLNEFYRKYIRTIKSRPSIAVFFLYYLQKFRKKDKILTSDVVKCFKDIAYPNWNKLNITHILASAKRRALVNYVNKIWSLTTTGEDYVLNHISGKAK